MERYKNFLKEFARGFGLARSPSYIYGVKVIKVMYLDIEVLGDRYEEMQELLLELNQEELENQK